jgi:hypothetical protein
MLFARSEVVLDQAILGLLINRRQGLPWGVKENKADLGRDSPYVDRFQSARVEICHVEDGLWPGTKECRKH